MSSSPLRFLQQEVARLRQENEVQRDQVIALNRCTQALSELYWTAQGIALERAPLAVFAQRLSDVTRAVGAEEGSLSRLDGETGDLVFMVVHGSLQEQLTGHHFKGDEGVAGWVIENGQPTIVNNPRQDWRFSGHVDREFAFLTRSILCVPVMRGGMPVGVIEMINKQDDQFTETDELLALVLSHLAAMALEKVESLAGGTATNGE
jgi:GAF domain-containing protein